MTPIERLERQEIVAAARAWAGTPYHHLGDIKGVGVDCAMLLVRVYVDLGLVEPFDPRPYSPDWMLHGKEELYLGFLLARAHEIARADMHPGDVVLFRFGRCFAHGGIVTNAAPLTLIHAFQPARRVIEDEPERNELSIRLKTAKFASFWPPSPAPREKGSAQPTDEGV